jgi:thymidylate synthase (FAD)
MKLIKQSFEILEQKDFSLIGIKKFIERCGRVCYKSEDKITDTSYEKFVGMLESRNHARPLEFGTVYLKYLWNGRVCDSCNQAFPDKLLDRYCNNKYSRVKYHGNDTYITTNYRVIIENHWEEDLKYLCEPTEYHDKRYTVHFITSRGIMDEFRTHVSLSHLAESTRYCNYSKDKFDNQITFIIPNWIKLKYDYVSTDDVGNNEIYVDGIEQDWYDEDDEITKEFLYGVQDAEGTYIKLLKRGCTPQQARDVLPLSVKSELISCGFKDAWDNFFYRRCAKDAHPMAKELAEPLMKEFITRKCINN